MRRTTRHQEIIVVNSGREAVYRAGYWFEPRGETTVSVTEMGRAEIKACQVLNIFEPGFRCDYPGCSYVAKDESALDLHKKDHKRRTRTSKKKGLEPEIEEELEEVYMGKT